MNPVNEIIGSSICVLGDVVDTYHLPKRKHKQISQTWIRKNVSRIDSIRNYTLLHRVIDHGKSQYFVFYDRYWHTIKQLSDFPKQTPKEILTIYLLYQGG